MSTNDVTVMVHLTGRKEEESGNDRTPLGGTATLCLYVCDARLMGAAATLVSQSQVEVSSTTAPTKVILPVPDDLSKLQQVGKAWQEMVEPSLYVALDNTSPTATLTYAKGPVSRIQPGQTVDMELRPKASK